MSESLTKAITNALGRYYRLLIEFEYLPASAVVFPPAEGWKRDGTALAHLERLGKTREALQLLSHLPYITHTQYEINYETEAIDWQSQLKGAAIGEHGQNLSQAGLEPPNENLPGDVVCLTNGRTYGCWLMLDVRTGRVTSYSILGSNPEPRVTEEQIAAGEG